jgi:hypothetical protein
MVNFGGGTVSGARGDCSHTEIVFDDLPEETRAGICTAVALVKSRTQYFDHIRPRTVIELLDAFGHVAMAAIPGDAIG